MKPYFEDKGIVIYHGDCREVLPTLPKVDLVLTDPPYGLGDWNNRGINAHGPFDHGFTQQWDKPITYEHVVAMLAAGKHQIIWGGSYFADLLPRTKQWLVWNKYIRNMHFNDCEIAWCSQFREASRMFDYSPSAMEPKEHPTQKPVALMKWCISLVKNAGTIIDPFAGSGTTLRAAKDLGRNAIGIEIEERYCEIAAKRLSQEVLNFDVRGQQTSIPEQLESVSMRAHG